MKPQKINNLLSHIKPIYTDKMSVETQIFMSFLPQKRIPEFLEVLILIVDYCQFFSQALIFNEYFAHTPDSQFNTLYKSTFPIAKFFSPGQSFEFINNNNIAILAMVLILSYLALKFLLIALMILIAVKKLKCPNFLLFLWKWFFKIHGRLLFYPVTSLWVGIGLAANQEKFDPFGIGNLPIEVVSIAEIILEYLLSLFIYMRYAYILPNKSFLATKNQRQEVINLTHKFVMHIIVISFTPDSMTNSFVFTVINLLLSLYSLYNFFRILPYYRMKALIYEGSFVVVFACLNFIYLLRSIIELVLGKKLLMDTAILSILVLIPLLVKATRLYLDRISFRLISRNKNEIPELLIQKIHIIKHFRKRHQRFNEDSNSFGLSYIIHKSYNHFVKEIFNIETIDNQKFDLNSKTSANKIFLRYLENSSLRFPKNDLIKLYLAYYYGRKFKDYGMARKILSRLQQFSSTKITLNASVLIYEIQKKLKTEYENNKGIDLSTYIYNLATITQFKLKIQEQADLQIKICQELNKNSPDLAKIFNYAQKVCHKRTNLEKKMREAFDTLPEYNIEPQLLSAHYQLMLNYSILDYLEHAKAFTKKCQKYAKHFTETDLCQANIYQKENGFLMVQGGATGTITYCSRSAENIFGKNLVSSPACSIFPTILQDFFFGFFRNPLEPKYAAFFGNIVRTFGLHELGYLVEIDLYVNIHPFINQGFFYDIIIHPIRSSKDYLMVSKNGVIEAYTQLIGVKLGLSSMRSSTLKKSCVVQDISKDLGKINLAYNLVNLKLKKKNSNKKLTSYHKDLEEIELNQEELEFHEAEALCSVFNSEGKPLVLTPLNSSHHANNNSMIYNCRVQTQFYASCFLKLLILEKTDLDREKIEMLRNSNRMSLEEINTCTKPGLIITEQKKNEILQSGKTIPTPGFPKTETDNIENMLMSYRLFSEKESCEITDLQREQTNYANFLQKSKTLRSTEEANTFLTRKQPTIRETKLEEQTAKAFSSKADNNTPRQAKKMRDTFETKWQQEEKNVAEKLEIAKKSLGSQKSGSSGQGRVSKALKEALMINYYPKYYNVFVPVFYCIFLGVFACQLSLKLTFDGDIGSRKEKKDVIKISETRNDMLTTIHRDLRYMQDLSSGRLEEVDFGIIRKTIPGYFESLENSLLYLGSLNNKLLLASKGLEEEFRQRLFDRNVRVFSTYFNEAEQKFIYMNNFQATERIVESGFKGLKLAKTNMSAGTPYFNFIFRNALNEFLLKCDETADMFLKALDTQEDNTLQNLEHILLATNMIILLIIMITGVIVARQCDTEKKHMIAFSKLNPAKVKEICDGIVRFKRVLEEDSSYDEVSSLDIFKFARTYQKVEMNSKKAKVRGIYMKYLQYWLNLIFLMVIVIVFVVLNYTIARDTITTLHFELHQIQFSTRIGARLNLAVAITQELLSRENTLIRNQPTFAQIDIGLGDVQTMRKELRYKFDTERKMVYDSTVETIVFQDACPYLTKAPKLACEATKLGTEHTSLLHSASQLESGITARRDGYTNSDKSPEALKKVQVDTINITVYPNLVLNYGTTVISETIEKVYEKQITDANAKSDLIWASTCIMMASVAVLAWYTLLTKIRRADGEFKKVLQTLPPNLITSNFILKSYLLKTSQGALDFVRNDI